MIQQSRGKYQDGQDLPDTGQIPAVKGFHHVFYQKGEEKMVQESENPSALEINWTNKINSLN